MGTDSSEERRESGAYGDTFRSDSMILARIDPRQKTVALVSIERDTYVNIEGYGPNKLNASAAFGGAPLVVSTVSTFAGVPISHYASIDFDGFKDVVDALGGIEVDVPMEIDDADAGGRLLRVVAGPRHVMAGAGVRKGLGRDGDQRAEQNIGHGCKQLVLHNYFFLSPVPRARRHNLRIMPTL